MAQSSRRLMAPTTLSQLAQVVTRGVAGGGGGSGGGGVGLGGWFPERKPRYPNLLLGYVMLG